jgi:hypothetical protein
MQVHSITLIIRSILIWIIIKDNATKYISIESNNTNYQNPNMIILVIQTYNLQFLIIMRLS